SLRPKIMGAMLTLAVSMSWQGTWPRKRGHGTRTSWIDAARTSKLTLLLAGFGPRSGKLASHHAGRANGRLLNAGWDAQTGRHIAPQHRLPPVGLEVRQRFAD